MDSVFALSVSTVGDRWRRDRELCRQYRVRLNYLRIWDRFRGLNSAAEIDVAVLLITILSVNRDKEFAYAL